MELINKNIKYLRQHKNMTQQAFADWLGITRSSVGAYEEGRAKPNFKVLQKLSSKFQLSLDRLLQEDLTDLTEQKVLQDKRAKSMQGGKLRILSITVDNHNRENIELVPEKAAAGYLAGYADPEYLQDLPHFRLPNLPEGSYRAFEISGDSMLPISSGSIIIGEYVENWENLKDGQPYIVLSRRDGIVFKRIFNQPGNPAEIILQSDNPAYPAYKLPMDELLEIWKAKAYISTIFPDSGLSLAKMMNLVVELQQEVIKLKSK